jgi:hypothetical protein
MMHQKLWATQALADGHLLGDGKARQDRRI